MDLISAKSLKTFSEYKSERLKLKIVHICPLDGVEKDVNCKRIVVTSDASAIESSTDRYLVVVLYGSLAKTPFKKSSLKVGQLFTLQRFQTGIMPNNKVFKCNGVVIKDFYEPLILVKSEFKPVIKMIVSVREETTDNYFVPIQDNDSIENICDSPSTEPIVVITDKEKTPKIDQSKQQSVTKRVKSPPKKRLKFDSSSSDDTDILSSDDEILSKIALRSSTSIQNEQEADQSMRSGKTIIKVHYKSPIKNSNRNESNTSSLNSANNSIENSRRHEYKTLIEVHNLMPVSGKTYVHVYGVLEKRDFVSKTINLRDEKAYTFSVQLRPGNSHRNYPAFKTGDLIRIHRLLLAPNSMDKICTDPKDIVVFEAFQDSESFSPIKTSLNPTFEDYDVQRKKELEEWFAEELMKSSLSEMKTSGGYVDIAVQVTDVKTYQNRSTLRVWDTTKPSLQVFRSEYESSAQTVDSNNEELFRIINENKMSVDVTVYDEHSMDVINMNLKPLDLIVIFNVRIRNDQRKYGFHNLILNSGYGYGKCIRFVNPNSYLGKKLLARIEEFKVMSAINTFNQTIPPNEELGFFPSQSQPIEDESLNVTEREIANLAAEEEAMGFSELDQDFDMNFDQVIDIVEREESYLPSVIIVDIPVRTILINELLTKGVQNQLYTVQARVMNYLPSDNKIDVISVLCSNQECQRIVTLREAIAEDSLIDTMIKSSKDQKIVLNCSKCKQSSGILVFKLSLILEDVRHDKVMAQLFGHNAELFFKGTPEDMIQNETKWFYVERVLSFICAKISSLDSHSSHNIILNWVIQPSKADDKNNLIYQIRTAALIDKVDKCVGFNSA